MKATSKFPWLYLLIAYGWTWLWAIPVILTRQDYHSVPILLPIIFIAVFGPGLAGIFLTHREGREAWRDFWQRAFDFRRIRWQWIFFMLLLWPATHLLANFLSNSMGEQVPASEMFREMTSQPWIIPMIVVLYLLQSAIEDLGWRGYMQEKLLRSWTPVQSALLVGIFHAFWHLPFFFIVGTNQIKMGLGINFWLFVFQAIAFSVFATWCYLDNHHSTLAVILLHTAGNLSLDIFAFQAGTIKFWLYTLFMVVGAIIVSLVFLKERKEVRHAQPLHS